MKITIKNRWNGSSLFETDAESLGAAIIAALAAKADIRDANLRGADLTGANLRDAVLTGADLTGADLRDAVLRGAVLTGANLTGADLTGANLRDDVLRGAALATILSTRTILPDGDLIGWKKLQENIICKLSIPAKAKRVGGLIGRKCRASFAVVLEGNGKAKYDDTEYEQGKTITPDSYDPNPLVECSHGIHFFITKEEAEAHN